MIVASFFLHPISHVCAGLIPVFLLLFGLVFLDTYKLIPLRSILLNIFLGCAAATLCALINSVVMSVTNVSFEQYARYGGPLVEEFFKAGYLAYLIRSKRIGFMVDGAIAGFAVGAGFAFVENLYYLYILTDANLLVWIIRGFGTAIMHGAATSIFAVVSKQLFDGSAFGRVSAFLPGLLTAIAIHSLFNHFFFSPVVSALLVLTLFPAVTVIVFQQGEKATREWLGVGFDADVDMLNMIISGDLAETKVGKYLRQMKEKFPGEIVADMLCLLRLHLELSVQAKGVLLMREAGFRPVVGPEIQEKFSELKYLEKSIGSTGRLAVAPILRQTSRDLWELYMLNNEVQRSSV